MQNRINTGLSGIVDSTGRAVTSTPMPVTFEKFKRTVIDRKRSNGADVNFTHVVCNGVVRAWIMEVPVPPNMPAGAPALCVWGFFSPEGEQILGRGTRIAVESAAIEFAQTVALNAIENEITGS
jgi:hypothetical protein